MLALDASYAQDSYSSYVEMTKAFTDKVRDLKALMLLRESGL